MAVVHAHAEDTLPFGIAPAKLRPVIHSGAFIGAEVPVWDIAKRFGDRTNLLVTNVAQGRDLAKSLRKNNVVLMRGHGFAAAASSLIDVVRMSVYLPRNARVQFRAMQLGRIKPLSKGEIQARTGGTGYKPQSPETQRAWQYWAERAGCADLLKAARLAQTWSWRNCSTSTSSRRSAPPARRRPLRGGGGCGTVRAHEVGREQGRMDVVLAAHRAGVAEALGRPRRRRR